MASLNVLALEPWYGGSHKNFLAGWAQHSRHTITQVTMAARFWKWRLQGGAITLARKTEALLENGYFPDVIFASSMTPLPSWLALMRGRLSQVPVVLFFHENQLTYPLREGEERDYTYAYIHYMSALSADRVVFNSEFHRAEFLEALPRLLKAFPDFTHLDTVREIEAKSSVLHLGLPLDAHDAYATTRIPRDYWGPGMDPPVILWNQRWEYDKNPEAFFRLLGRLDDVGCAFKLILAGEHFEHQPVVFDRAFERFAGRILHYGYAEDFAEYSRLLHRADLVVSTAVHEFFGIALLEAIHCGAHPLLPERLSYPELIPKPLQRPLLHAPILYKNDDALFHTTMALLKGDERPLPQATLRSIPASLNWPLQAVRFDDLIEKTALRGGAHSS